MENYKKGDLVKIKVGKLSFTGEIVRAGKDKLQVKQPNGGMPLWYPKENVVGVRLEVKEEKKVYGFWFAGAKKEGTIENIDGEKYTMKSTKKGEGSYPVKKSDVELGEVPTENPMVEAETIKTGKAPKKVKENIKASIEAEVVLPKVEEEEPKTEIKKATILGEAIISYLQKNTLPMEKVQCRTVTEISDAVGKTQPQIKAALNTLNDLDYVLIGVCDKDPNTAALTPQGFDYVCGEPVNFTTAKKDGKKVTKRDLVIGYMKEGKTPTEISELVGCDKSYATISSTRAKYKEIFGEEYNPKKKG